MLYISGYFFIVVTTHAWVFQLPAINEWHLNESVCELELLTHQHYSVLTGQPVEIAVTLSESVSTDVFIHH